MSVLEFAARTIYGQRNIVANKTPPPTPFFLHLFLLDLAASVVVLWLGSIRQRLIAIVEIHAAVEHARAACEHETRHARLPTSLDDRLGALDVDLVKDRPEILFG